MGLAVLLYSPTLQYRAHISIYTITTLFIIIYNLQEQYDEFDAKKARNNCSHRQLANVASLKSVISFRDSGAFTLDREIHTGLQYLVEIRRIHT